MSALDRLAERMFGGQRLETTAAMASVDTQTYIGVATSDSADGSVSVVLSDDVTQPDNGIWDDDTFLASDELGTSVELPTTTAVREGDRVLVTASGANVMATPVVTGVVGRGDEQQAQIDAAAEAAASVEGIAQEALDVAEATGQHFWSDTDGIHVTEVTEEEWSDSTGSGYHSGANVLLNALGQLFRDGLNNLLAVLPTGIAIYDGNGNAASNILAQFTASIIRLGGRFAASGRSTAKVQFFEDDSALTDLTAEHYLNTTTAPQVSHDLALSSTITDDELPDGTSRTVTGNVEVWEQIYHSGSTYSDEVTASLNGTTTNRQNNVSMGVQAIESSGASSQRIAFVTADTVRLTSGTGRQSVTSDHTMPQARAALNCRSNTNGWVNSDGYANTNRAIYVGARVNNSSSSVNGHDISLYLGPAGLNLYDATAARTLWNFGLNNPHFAVWPGSKVMTINASSFTLLTKAQLQAIVGTDWTPTGANCSVFVMNGEDGVTDAMMNASIDGNSIVRVHMNKTRNGIVRVNYLIVRFAA